MSPLTNDSPSFSYLVLPLLVHDKCIITNSELSLLSGAD